MTNINPLFVPTQKKYSSSSAFLDSIRPILIVSKLLGMFPAKNVITNLGLPTCTFPSLDHLYQTIYLLCLLGSGITTFVYRTKFEDPMNDWVISYMQIPHYILVCGCNFVTTLYMSLITSRLCRLCVGIHGFENRLNVNVTSSPLIRRMSMFIMITLLVAVPCWNMWTLLASAPIPWKVVVTISNVMNATPTLHVIFIASALRRLFRGVNQRLATCPPYQLAHFCRCHLEISWIVDMVSDTYGWILLIMYLQNLFQVVCISYILIFYSSSAGSVHEKIILLACGLVSLSIPALMSEQLSEEARSTLKHLQQASWCQLSPDCRKEIAMLMHKLYVDPPTITAANFFPINRSLLTSIGGAITTYLVVLVQFKTGETTGPVNTGNSSTAAH